jgi:hypothetical protein
MPVWTFQNVILENLATGKAHFIPREEKNETQSTNRRRMRLGPVVGLAGGGAGIPRAPGESGGAI